MNTCSVTLKDMLACRERRAARQRALLARFEKPLICLSMNIPGPQKDSPLIRLAFEAGAARLLAHGTPLYAETLSVRTGPEGYFVMDMPPQALKTIAMEAEEQDALGRLLDMDVLDAAGEKLARPVPRACLLCGSPAAVCARSRAHGLDALTHRVQEILIEHAAVHYGDAAYRALLAEAFTTPKPGLVDGENHGAHTDMCLSTLLSSANALRPFFAEFLRAGISFAGGAQKELMEALRAIGLSAEAAMLRAAGGVNAHKGSIYALGLLLGAQGLCLMQGGDVLETAAALAAADMPAQLRRAMEAPHTHGENLYARYGVKGARGEAAAGFPHAVSAANALACYGARGPNEAGALALCEVMAALEDTNLLHRGDMVGMRFVQARAREILMLPTSARLAALRALDAEMIRRNLSPGGAADMLTLGFYLAATLHTPGALSRFARQG